MNVIIKEDYNINIVCKILKCLGQSNDIHIFNSKNHPKMLINSKKNRWIDRKIKR